MPWLTRCSATAASSTQRSEDSVAFEHAVDALTADCDSASASLALLTVGTTRPATRGTGTAAACVPSAPTALVDMASMDKQRLSVSEQSTEAVHQLASETSARASSQTVQRRPVADKRPPTCAVQSRKLHLGSGVRSLHHAARCLAVEEPGGEA